MLAERLSPGSPLMKLALAVLSLSLCIGCKRSDSSRLNPADAAMRNTMIGTWTRQTNHLSGMITLGSDGTFKAGWTNSTSEPVRSWLYEGYWTITGGVCVATQTKSDSVGTTNHAPLRTDHFKVITVDAEHLAWESDGQTTTLTRKK